MSSLVYGIVAINEAGLAFGMAGAWLIRKKGLLPADIEKHGLLLQSSPTCK